ncbi:DUF4236 domain-containing protein [Clostridium tyrobutyricum]|uniref:DUF4236 domain-containing protein n=1 Tax=Clostridium tyrobutyricum TaxID=1519 RepID=UPI001C38FC00|nr:DUF4236 domain-containing protein [Clostridium tyrobutyricum]MBV4417457.1 DUF4236 domain-containing protein [Clostridium tyrobutyricum]
MGFRVRRSIKIAPGVKLNIGKKGINSVSIGGHGFTKNIGKHGTRTTVGIPGTGISYSNYKKYNSKPKISATDRLHEKAIQAQREIDSYKKIPFEMDIVKYPKILCAEWIGIILGFILGFAIHPAIFVLTFIPLIMALFTSIFNKQLKAKNNQLKAVRSYQKNNMIDCVNRCKKSLKYMDNESTRQLMELAENELKGRAE